MVLQSQTEMMSESKKNMSEAEFIAADYYYYYHFMLLMTM